ncbi:MAG: thiamine phosphate synthase [Kofleriaceae bacterium]|nr:thiamine phosphate synthase [Kofleriaceae bacterium]
MEIRDAIRGAYAILDRDDAALAEVLVARAAGGARVLQVRLKPVHGPAPSTAALLAVARMAREVTRRHGAALVINDRLDLAVLVGADGVHLGQDDLPLADARVLLATAGLPMWIGVSTHDADQVRAAIAGGADYLGYGPVFATTTKANPDRVQGLPALAAAVALAGAVPVVAIGGVTPAHGPALAGAGAAAAAAISAITDAPDPAAAVRALAAAWDHRT